MMLPWRQRAVIEQGVTRDAEGYVAPAGCHAFAAGSNSDDQLVHKVAIASGIGSARSSAIISGPASSAARP